MLTVDFERWGVTAGELLLDLGCGRGRHSFEALRRGLDVVSVDLDRASLNETARMADAMVTKGEVSSAVAAGCVVADALRLPFDDDVFDRVVASEVLEHIELDEVAMSEIARVLKPGGSAAVTVPRWWPERVCWALSDDYHTNDGGHVRIYSSAELTGKLASTGLVTTGSHHAHALHSPYWWLKCAFGPDNDQASLPKLYHRLLVWDITARPAGLRLIERVLDPIVGKSLVVYLDKPSRVHADV